MGYQEARGRTRLKASVLNDGGKSLILGRAKEKKVCGLERGARMKRFLRVSHPGDKKNETQKRETYFHGGRANGL